MKDLMVILIILTIIFGGNYLSYKYLDKSRSRGFKCT